MGDKAAVSPIDFKHLPRAERRKLKKKAKRRNEAAKEDGDDTELLSLEDDFLRRQEEQERLRINALWLAKEEEVILVDCFHYCLVGEIPNLLFFLISISYRLFVS